MQSSAWVAWYSPVCGSKWPLTRKWKKPNVSAECVMRTLRSTAHTRSTPSWSRNEIHADVANYVALVARLAHGDGSLAQRRKGHCCLRESSTNKSVGRRKDLLVH